MTSVFGHLSFESCVCLFNTLKIYIYRRLIYRFNIQMLGNNISTFKASFLGFQPSRIIFDFGTVSHSNLLFSQSTLMMRKPFVFAL